MKKQILITALIAISAVTVALLPALADPGDVVITLTIPAEKVADFRAGFLERRPIRGNYTEKEWIKKIVLDYILSIYRAGKQSLAVKTAVADPNVII